MNIREEIARHRDQVAMDEARIAYWWARKFTYYCSLVFFACFSAIQINAISLVKLTMQIDPDVFVRAGLLLYCNAWLFGARLDTSMNEQVFVVDPERGRFPWSFVLILPGFVVLAGALLFVADNVQHLSLALAAFWFVDLGMWWNYVRFMKPRGLHTAAFYTERRMFPQLEKLKFMLRHYVTLDWQLKRFSCMAVVLLLFLLTAHSEQARDQVHVLLAHVLPGTTAERIVTGLPHALFLVYVLLAEAWSWWMRLKTNQFIRAVDEIKNSYVLWPAPIGP